jgi:DNA-binding MarR family transcriptional regulator
MRNDLDMLPMLFGMLHKKMMEQHHEVLTKHGLNKTHIPYIMFLSKHKEGLTQKEMSEKLFLDKGHTSRALKELVDCGIIRKDQEKTYKNKYYLEVKGIAIIKEIKAASDVVKEKIEGLLTDGEIQVLRNLIQKIMQLDL